MIKVTSLNKYYSKGKSNQIHVINNTTLNLPDTGFVTFLGQSGSGKTTLLNTIGGLDKATGKIEYGDTTITNYNVKKIDKYRSEHIGYVFQTYNLLKSLSVAENIKISLELIGITDKEEIEKRITFSLQAVNMLKFRRRTANALSGGQQQRVSIARALAKNANIIIADEPTGNLDSENGIEVMNILKTLSRDRLVLLVTHDQGFAEFYSDRIIEISDGSVIGDNLNSDMDNTINTKSEREIYLGDLEKENKNLNNYKVEYYSANDVNVPDLNLKFIYNKGNIYIEGDKPIKLVGKNEDIKLLPGKYKGFEKADADEFSFDMSNFSKPKNKLINWSVFGSNLKTAFFDFFRVKKGRKFLNFCLILLGIVEGIMVISYGLSSNYDDKNLSYIDNGYSIKMPDSAANNNKLNLSDAVLNNDIDDVLNLTTTSISLKTEGFTMNYGGWSNYDTSDFESYDEPNYNSGLVQVSNYNLPVSLLNNKSLVLGTYPKNNFETLIDVSLIDSINSTRETNIIDKEAFIGKKISNSGFDFIISGIVNSSSTAFYYTNYILASLDSSRTFRNGYSYSEIKSYGQNNEGYEVVLGSDFTLPYSSSKQILLNINLLGNSYTYSSFTREKYFTLNDNNTVTIKDDAEVERIYNIVGYYISAEESYYITNDTISTFSTKLYFGSSILSIYTNNKNSIYYRDVELTSGQLPKSDNEIVVSSYGDYKIGDSIDVQTGNYDSYTDDGLNVSSALTSSFIIVGLSDKLVNFEALTTSNGKFSTYSQRILPSTVFRTKNTSKIENYLLEYKDFNLKDNKDAITSTALESHKKTTRIFELVAVITLIITVVFTYLVMRSRMFSKIYDIGVYRALGANKKRIYGLFTYDIIILTIFTNLLGYLIVFGIYKSTVNGFGEILSMITEVQLSTQLLIIGIPVIFLFNLVFGLLPIYTLLRKSPAQILAKYDI